MSAEANSPDISVLLHGSDLLLGYPCWYRVTSVGAMLCLGVPCCCLFHCPTVPACQGPGHGDRTHTILHNRSNESGWLDSHQTSIPATATRVHRESGVFAPLRCCSYFSPGSSLAPTGELIIAIVGGGRIGCKQLLLRVCEANQMWRSVLVQFPICRTAPPPAALGRASLHSVTLVVKFSGMSLLARQEGESRRDKWKNGWEGDERKVERVGRRRATVGGKSRKPTWLNVPEGATWTEWTIGCEVINTLSLSE